MAGTVSPEGVRYYEQRKTEQPPVEALAAEVVNFGCVAQTSSFG
jgi:hypothetical protein